MFVFTEWRYLHIMTLFYKLCVQSIWKHSDTLINGKHHNINLCRCSSSFSCFFFTVFCISMWKVPLCRSLLKDKFKYFWQVNELNLSLVLNLIFLCVLPKLLPVWNLCTYFSAPQHIVTLKLHQTQSQKEL
jgi:hypothetical protein